MRPSIDGYILKDLACFMSSGHLMKPMTSSHTVGLCDEHFQSTSVHLILFFKGCTNF